MKKKKFYIQMIDNEGTIFYYMRRFTKRDTINGVLMSYMEYELTEDINKACEFADSYVADIIIDEMKMQRPRWFEQFDVKLYQIVYSNQIYVNTRPFALILHLLKGYKNASEESKKRIEEKLFNNDKLYNACEFAINELIRLKK